MKKEENREVEEDEIILWDNLPRDVLGLITSRLSAPEFSMFRGVCKSWRQWFETSSYHPNLAAILKSMGPSDDVMRFPILMTVHRKFCSFFHPMYNTTIRRVIPELVDATLFHTKGAWLLLARRMEFGDDDSAVIFFFNVKTMVKIDVPLSIHPNGFTFIFKEMCFFSNPDSTDWSIIGTNSLYIGTIKHGQPAWTVSELHSRNVGISINPMVVVNGEKELCYILGNNGTLFSFDPTKLTSAGKTRLRKVSKKPPLPPLQTVQYNRHHVQIVERFLVPIKGEGDGDGDLLAIFKYTITSINDISKNEKDISRFLDYERTYITSVYEFNIANREWRKLENLGNRMLFVSRTGSMLFQVGEEAANTMMIMAKNKVYYPDVRMGNNIFFSLSTESNLCFLSKANPSNHHGHRSAVTKQKIGKYPSFYIPSNCGWIGPMPLSFFRSI